MVTSAVMLPILFSSWSLEVMCGDKVTKHNFTKTPLTTFKPSQLLQSLNVYLHFSSSEMGDYPVAFYYKMRFF